MLTYSGFLASRIATHHWLVGARGEPLPTDFFAVWSAGNLARHETAAAAYVPEREHAAEEATLRRNLPGRYDWPYPPFYFFVVIPLAVLGYVQAFIVWDVATLCGYAAATVAIARSRASILFALAAPWTLNNLLVGQNGFLTAALIGFVLLGLERRPALSGILLGLLAYKPQFGLLFPFALAAGGYWRQFAWATASVVVLVTLSSATFGASTLVGFLHALTTTAQTLVVEGQAGWQKLQSIYGLARWLGLASSAAWFAQTLVTVGSVASIVFLWRSDASNALKAAGLCAASLLATPYVWVYDLAILAMAVAFLHRDRSIDGLEWAVVGLATFEVGAYMLGQTPTGWFATLSIAALVVRRLLLTHHGLTIPSSDAKAIRLSL